MIDLYVLYSFAEISSRTSGGFDQEFVIGIEDVFDSETDEAVKRGFEKYDEIKGYPFAIVMQAGERNLIEIINSESLCGDKDKIRFAGTEIIKALKHMHDNGFCHADVKVQ
jgi:serine/threonine protein kinase